MSWHPPSPSEVWKAIEVYLAAAYSGEPPSAVQARMDTLRSLSDADFYESSVFEREVNQHPNHHPHPQRYRLRLGNPFYPHMKMVIERSPDGKGHLFRADTHDQHCCPDPKSRDYGPFCKLMEKNQAVAQTIESAWEQQGLPTFKTYLKQDLARRKG